MRGATMRVLAAGLLLSLLGACSGLRPSLSRRSVLRVCPAILLPSLLGGPLPAAADAWQAGVDGGAGAVRATFPKGWYVSDRSRTDTFGAKTLVSGLDVRSGFASSVTVTDVRKLLEDFYGMDTSNGRAVASLKEIGGGERVAQLLQRQRDGSLKQAPLTSEVKVVSEGATELTFETTTTFKPKENAMPPPQTPFGAPMEKSDADLRRKEEELKPLVRRTKGRAFLVGSDAKLVTLWMSAVEEDWARGTAETTAQAVLDSFQVQP